MKRHFNFPNLLCLVVLISGLLLTFWGVYLTRKHYGEVARVHFETTAEKLLTELDRRMKLPVYGLKGAAGVYAASKSVDRLEFRAYVESRDLTGEFPGVLGFGFMQRVPRSELPSFIRRERLDHAPDFNVVSKGDDPVMYVIKFLDPLESNRKAWGYDAGSEPVRREAIERAGRTGLPALTRRLTLLQTGEEEAGFLWLVPVYRKGGDVTTAETREASLYGLVFAHLSLNRVFAHIMEETGGMLDVEISEGTEPASAHLLLDADQHLVSAAEAPLKNPFGGRLFHLTRQIEIGGETWTYVFTSTRKYEQSVENALPAALAGGGLLLTGALVLLIWSLGNSRTRAIRLAETMTESLRLSEAEARKLAVVASRTDNAVIISDARGRIEWVNQGFTKITGYQPLEVKGRKPGEFLQGPLTSPEAVAKMREGLKAGEGFKVEILNYGKSGTPYWLAIESQPLRDESGLLTGFMAIESDITVGKRLEQELLEAKRVAEEASRAKSEFLAVMSHEIRTPMNGVIGMTSLLLETPLNDSQRDFTEIIRSSGETLISLINDILDFSKIESGKLELECVPFNIRDCVEGTLDILSMTADKKGIDLLYEIRDEVPAQVQGDINRLRQILVNLVGNSLKFTQKGEIEITVQSKAMTGQQHELIFAVRDTGIGISAEAQDRLFRPFSQVDASTTRKYGGTGLGLAISRRLAELMGGRMWVASEPGRGSTFFFTILAEAALSQPKPYLSITQQELKGKRLFLVDDNATNRRILVTLAEKWGIEAVAAESGEEALKVLAEDLSFDFMILDMQMPGMDGVMLAQEIHLRHGPKTPPLMLLSSMGTPEGSEAKILFAASMTKPAKPNQIFNALMKMAGKDNLPLKGNPENASGGPLIPFGPVRILLAEDNKVNQKVAHFLLASLGYAADPDDLARNGLEVLEAVAERKYGIILMDVQMPEMDGLEATRRIRSTAPLGEKSPWIIALTANAMTEDREICLAAGMNDYLSKPLKKESLAASLIRALQNI